jgi:hypothetical protein
MTKIPKLFFKESKDTLLEEIHRIMDLLDKLHVSCHEVSPQDAHKFYHNNPFMHECVDEIIHGVNSVRVSIASIPKERWPTIEQEEYVIEAFENVEKSIEYCLDKFAIKDL